jgi:hypothetical protein
MTKPDPKQKYARWQRLVDEQQTSGLSQKEFCKKYDLVLSQFVYYRCQIKNESAMKESGFTPVKVATQDRVTTSGDIKLILPNGFQCIFTSHTDAGQIKRLVEVLLSC